MKNWVDVLVILFMIAMFIGMVFAAMTLFTILAPLLGIALLIALVYAFVEDKNNPRPRRRRPRRK